MLVPYGLRNHLSSVLTLRCPSTQRHNQRVTIRAMPALLDRVTIELAEDVWPHHADGSEHADPPRGKQQVCGEHDCY